MAVERITPQLVKKGKGIKRPGYRGPGGYQGGGGRSSRSSGPAGGASAGGNYGGNRNPSQSSKSPSRSPRGPQELGTSTRTVNRITAPPPTTYIGCLLYTSPSPRDRTRSRMPSSA